MSKLSDKNFRCIAPCMRGFGYTTYNNPISGLKEIVVDLQLFISKILKFEKFYIIG